jgi:hypothetical protein
MSRAAAIKRVYGSAKRLGLDDETRRDAIERATGKRSLTLCSDAEVEAVARALGGAAAATPTGLCAATSPFQGEDKKASRLEANTLSRASRVRVAGQAHQRVIKAIWIGLYNLGCVDDGRDSALDVFVARQTAHVKQVERLEWLTADAAPSVIEALKAMAARAGWDASQATLPDLGGGKLDARARLLIAQWRRLEEMGKVAVKGRFGLDGFLRVVSGPPERCLTQFTPAELDAGSKRLGQMIRKAQARSGGPRTPDVAAVSSPRTPDGASVSQPRTPDGAS